jgi:Ca2+-binding RTX toxin-like protein
VANIFDVQGFGALSEWNGQFSSASANQAFQTIASLGSNSIELTARIWTQTGTTNSVIADPAKTESDASLLAGFQAAQAAGLSVVFKAAISPLNGTPTSSMAPTDVGAFFASYKAEIVHLATIAQAGGVATFAIGNEMSSLSGQQYRDYWTDLISAVRQVYHGELTYAAATDEASKVSFWDQVDTIGVNTYPPLTSSNTPTVQDLVHAWSEVPINPYYAAAFEYKSPVDFLHSLSEQYGKPVLMTEVGYRSIDGTAIAPGSWTASGTSNTSAQADAYNAFFQVWTAHGGSWLKGVELWQWDLNNQYNSTGYSVMGKPAEVVVSQYFLGNGAAPGLTVTGSSVADIIDLGQGNDVINGELGDDVIHGGAGNDVIIGGPSVAAKLATTTITLTGYGSVVGGIGAQAQILVNGKPVSGLFEFKPATDPSGYQTFTVSFNNPDAITSVDIELVNATPGRALHIKDFSINGVALAPGDATNASSPGSFDLYVHTIHFDTSNHQDWFFGASTDNDVIYGGAGDDVITGGIGNDFIDGGDGIDTAAYSGNISDYNISVVGKDIIVSDKIAGRDGIDTLTNIEFLKFADTTIGTSNLSANLPGFFSDGSRYVYTSAIAGKDYASELDVISASGVTTLIERFFANGDLAFRQTVNSDGSVDSANYDAEGYRTQFATSYVDGSFDQFTFNASGFKTSETIQHADGSRDIYSSGITGKDYTSQHVINDPSGQSVLIEDFRADGSLTLKQTVDASDVKTLDQYDSLGHIVQHTVIQKDGSYLQSSYAPDGTLTIETLGHADGSRDIYSSGIVGEGYTSQHVINDAIGRASGSESVRADGSLTLQQVVDASGVQTLDQYDGLGHTVQETVTQNDGSYVQSSYTSDGTLTTVTLGHADGSRDIYSSGITDKDYTSQHVINDASGHSVLIQDFRADGSLTLQQVVDASGVTTLDTYGITGQAYSARHDVTDASGHRLATTLDNNDGSHTMTAHAPGVTLTSTTANDVMNSAGGDTFVFKQPSGHDVINNFNPGDTAGHDIIQIESAVAVDFAHLSVHVVGQDTVIDLGHDASVTLAGVITPLTSHDVLIA